MELQHSEKCFIWADELWLMAVRALFDDSLPVTHAGVGVGFPLRRHGDSGIQPEAQWSPTGAGHQPESHPCPVLQVRSRRQGQFLFSKDTVEGNVYFRKEKQRIRPGLKGSRGQDCGPYPLWWPLLASGLGPILRRPRNLRGAGGRSGQALRAECTLLPRQPGHTVLVDKSLSPHPCLLQPHLASGSPLPTHLPQPPLASPQPCGHRQFPDHPS